MPFKSEKQRRYLWANEPEIARDWTDTYGSKIKKADGGRIGFKDGSDDYGQFSRAVSRAANNPTRSSVPDRGGDHGQFQRRIDHTAANKQMAEREARDSISNRIKHHGLGTRKRQALQQMGLINKPGFNMGIMGQLLDTFTGQIPEHYKNMSDDELEALALEINKMKAGGQNVSVDVDLFDRVNEGKRLLDENELPQSEWERLFGKGPPQDTGGEGGGLPYIWPPYQTGAIEEDPTQETLVSDTDWNFVLPERFLKGPRVAQVAEGGRVPAAFGGIMDSYTGRRAYGLGSVFKKITSLPKKAAKVVKKLTSTPIGKLALSYLATAGMANVMQPGAAQWGSPLGKGSGWLRTGQVWKNLSALGPGATTTEGVDIGFQEALRKQKEKSLLTKGIKFAKSPLGMMTLGGAGIGAASAMGPQQIEADIGGERNEEKAWWDAYIADLRNKYGNFEIEDEYKLTSAEGGRVPAETGGLMNLGGLEKDYRNEGGFVPIGVAEKADDVPARLSKNEFVMTADAVRGAGGGDIDRGAQVMETVMDKLQGKHGRQEMFETSERLSEVV